MPDGDFKAKVQHEVGMLPVRITGERRPMLLATVIEAGIQALRPHATPEQKRQARLDAIDNILELMERVHPAPAPQDSKEVVSLRKRLAQLEARFAADPIFTAAEIVRMRTLHEYGMTHAQLAKLFTVDTKAIRRALSTRELAALPGRSAKTGQGRGRRALDVD